MSKPCKPTLKYYAIMADNYARFAKEALLIDNRSRYNDCVKREYKYRNLAQQLQFEENTYEQVG